MKINSSTSNSRIKEIQKLCLKLLMFFQFLFAIIGINYLVDPGNIYSGAKIYKCYANAISSGKNVAGFSNLDERKVKSSIMEKLQKVPDVAIFGSSRSMMLGDGNFAGKSVFNSSVSGAILQDFIGLFYKYAERNEMPKIVVLGIDPWIFNKNVKENRWESITDDYNEMLLRLQGSPQDGLKLFSEKDLNILSLSYLSKSIDLLKTKSSKKKSKDSSACIITDEKSSDDFAMILKDGRHVYDKAYREKSQEQVEQEAISYANQRPVYHLENFNEIHQDNAKLLSNFVNYLKSQNIKVLFFLNPYHPTTYKLLSENPMTKIINQVELYVRVYSKLNNILVIGSYNPANYDLTPEYFYDGMHTKSEGDKQILEKDKIILDAVLKF